LVRAAYNSTHPKRAKSAKKAQKRLKVIADRQVRESERKLTTEQQKNTAKICIFVF
jgi:IS5 family transposase